MNDFPQDIIAQADAARITCIVEDGLRRVREGCAMLRTLVAAQCGNSERSVSSEASGGGGTAAPVERLGAYGTDADASRLRRELEGRLAMFIGRFCEDTCCSDRRLHDALSAIADGRRTEFEAELAAELERRGRPDLRSALRSRLPSFDDILLLGDRDIQKVLRNSDWHDLAAAIGSSEAAIRETLFRNMSRRRAEALREVVESISPVPEDEVRRCRERIALRIRQLADAGEICLTASARAGG